MKIVVTGGGGFLGLAICRQLLARGDQVIAYQRSGSTELERSGAKITRGDITDAALLDISLRGVDAVIHCAGKAGTWGDWDSYFATNVTGTQNVISACRNNSVRRLVFTSSPSVVHAGDDIEGGDETLPYPEHFDAPYPATKALAEQQVMAASSQDLKTIALRPHLIWGPGDRHLLPRLVARARGGKLKLPGPHKLIDTVYVENAARAHLLALDKLESNPQRIAGKAYFISNDEPRKQGDIITGLLKAAGVEVSIQTMPPALAMAAGTIMETAWRLLRLASEPPVTRWSANHLSTAHWYDITAAKEDLGYRVDISIEEGLALLQASFASTA